MLNNEIHTQPFIQHSVLHDANLGEPPSCGFVVRDIATQFRSCFFRRFLTFFSTVCVRNLVLLSWSCCLPPFFGPNRNDPPQGSFSNFLGFLGKSTVEVLWGMAVQSRYAFFSPENCFEIDFVNAFLSRATAG